MLSTFSPWAARYVPVRVVLKIVAGQVARNEIAAAAEGLLSRTAVSWQGVVGGVWRVVNAAQ